MVACGMLNVARCMLHVARCMLHVAIRANHTWPTRLRAGRLRARPSSDVLDRGILLLPPLPHLHRDWAHPCHICTGAAPSHICTGTRLVQHNAAWTQPAPQGSAPQYEGDTQPAHLNGNAFYRLRDLRFDALLRAAKRKCPDCPHDRWAALRRRCCAISHPARYRVQYGIACDTVSHTARYPAAARYPVQHGAACARCDALLHRRAVHLEREQWAVRRPDEWCRALNHSRGCRLCACFEHVRARVCLRARMRACARACGRAIVRSRMCACACVQQCFGLGTGTGAAFPSRHTMRSSVPSECARARAGGLSARLRTCPSKAGAPIARQSVPTAAKVPRASARTHACTHARTHGRAPIRAGSMCGWCIRRRR